MLWAADPLTPWTTTELQLDCVIVAQSCPLCDAMDCSLPGSFVHGILQARILEWVAVPLSTGSSRPRDWTWVSHPVSRFFTSWATREAFLGNLSLTSVVLKTRVECHCSLMHTLGKHMGCFPHWITKTTFIQGYCVPPEKAMAPHSSTLAWKIPWMEEPGRLQSMGSPRVGYDWATSFSRIGEGNGNPLQCSCLENPRVRGPWWAAVYGVAQSRTQLKRLSSSSSVFHISHSI